MTLEVQVHSELVVTIDDQFECTYSHSTMCLTAELGGIATTSEIIPGVVGIAEVEEFFSDPYYGDRRDNITFWPADMWDEMQVQDSLPV